MQGLNHIISIPVVFIIVFLHASIFAIVGRKILLNYFETNFKYYNLFYKYSFGYFVGIFFFTAIWKVLDIIIQNAILTYFISLIIAISYLILDSKENYRFKINFFDLTNFFHKFNITNSLPFILISIITYFFWMRVSGNLACDFIGTLSTAPYAIIAEYIYKYNYLPTIQHNLTQSIISSVPQFYSSSVNTIFPLFLWLVISIGALFYAIGGLLNHLNISKTKIFIFTIIILYGSTSLSIVKILTVDSGWPIALTGYTDTILANVAILIFFFFYKDFLEKKHHSIKNIIILLIFLISNSLYGAQNILIIGAIFTFLLFIRKTDLRKNLIMLFLLFLALLFSFSIGGLLTQEMFVNFNNYESNNGCILLGMNTRADMSDQPFLSVVPSLRYFAIDSIGNYASSPFVWAPIFMGEWGYLLPKDFSIRAIMFTPFYFISSFEVTLWNAMRISFWPFIGIFSYLTIIKLKLVTEYKNFNFYSLLIFLIGGLVTYAFSINGMKWEMSRFFMAGYFLGMINLVLFLNYMYNSLNFKYHKYVNLLIILILFGTFYHAGAWMIVTFAKTFVELDIIDQLQALFFHTYL